MKSSILDFDSVSKQQWIEKINEDLKTKDITKLYWEYNDNFTIDPFTHKDDIKKKCPPILSDKKNNNWKIGAGFSLNSVTETNVQIKHFLTQGANYISIDIDNKWNLDDLLRNVHLTMIDINFGINDIIGYEDLLISLLSYIENNETQINKSNIGFKWNGSNENYKQYLLLTKKHFASSKFIHIESTDNSPTTQLYELLNLTHSIFESERDENLIDNIMIHIHIDSIYLFEIAKIRAFRKLWYSLTKNIGLNYNDPRIIIHSKNNGIQDANDNLILLTIQCMIAAVSGIYAISVSNNTNHSDIFYERIAMNIQHIIKLESKMNIVQDPMAGSYHFELLTEQITSKVWKLFIAKN